MLQSRHMRLPLSAYRSQILNRIPKEDQVTGPVKGAETKKPAPRTTKTRKRVPVPSAKQKSATLGLRPPNPSHPTSLLSRKFPISITSGLMLVWS